VSRLVGSEMCIRDRRGTAPIRGDSSLTRISNESSEAGQERLREVNYSILTFEKQLQRDE
jgi:hypothetical protein